MKVKIREGKVEYTLWFNDWNISFGFKYSWHFNYSAIGHIKSFCLTFLTIKKVDTNYIF